MKIKTHNKNMLIGGLLVAVLVMVVAYAALASNLQINGTANVSSTWDVEIISVTPDKTATNSGTAQSPNYTTPGDITHSITNNNLTANFDTALVSPGDTVTYTIVVKNKGTIDAMLNNTTKTDANNPAIIFTVSGLTNGERLNAGASKTFTVVVAYSSSVTGQPASTDSTLSLTLNYTQYDPNYTPPAQTVYSWNTSTITVGTSQLTDLVSTKTTNPYYTSEADIQSALNGKTGSTIYNKYTVENDTITEGYVCQTFGILSRAECIKMSTDGSEYGYDAGGNHTGNAGILKALQSNSTFTGASGSCTFHSSNSDCFVGSLYLDADSHGDVGATDTATYAYCRVYNSGNAYCSVGDE